MDLVWLTAVLALFLGGVLVLAAWVCRKSKEFHAPRRAIAERHPGVAWTGSEFTLAGVGWKATIREESVPWNDIVAVRYEFASPLPAVQVQTRRTLPGTSTVKTGDPSLDVPYEALATPPALAREFLSGRVRQALIEMIEAAREEFWFETEGTTARFVPGGTPDLPVFEAMLVHAGSLGDALAGWSSAGIRLETVELSSEGRCPVCGAGWSTKPVRCRRCRTPHHQDCWNYLGRCSTFACGGRSFE